MELHTTVRFAADSGSHYWAYSIGDALRGYYFFRMHAVDWEAAGRAALASAVAAQDQQAEVAANVSLAGLFSRSGRHDAAVEHGGRALRLARRITWLEGQVSALGNLGTAEAARGKPARAVAHFQQALDLSRRIGWRHGEASSLTNLGSVAVEMGDNVLALDCATSALALNTELHSANGRALNMINLAVVHLLAGQLEVARSELEDAFWLCQRVGSSSGRCVSQRCQAAVELEAGNYDTALELANASVAIARDKGLDSHEANGLSVIALVSHRCGAFQQAVEGYRRALLVADRFGRRDTLGRTEARLGLADSLRCIGDIEPARDHATAVLAVARQAPFRHLEASAMRVLAGLDLAAGNYREAGARATASAALHGQFGHRLDEARVRQLLGHIRHALGDHDGARRHWHGARELLAGTGTPT